jgi:pantoate--beta-alanine ligase
MKVVKNSEDLRAFLKDKGKVGFVPTMGALHHGHMSLIKRAIDECDVTVCSVFVNPAQFNNSKDLEKYPRPIDKDIELLAAHNCDVLYLPSEAEIYPEYEEVKIDYKSLKEHMEGPNRPGHFEGVVTVINRFFELLRPDRAYFGEKDFQQLAIIRELVEQKNWNIEIIGCPIVREENGLASSSRNMRLSQEGKNMASAVYKMLSKVERESLIYSLGTAIERAKEELADDFELEYLLAVDGNSLLPVEHLNQSDYIQLCTAVWLEDVRLIDNICIKKND